MALTKVSRGLLSTGIVDNSTTTAITIDSSENVGVGTSSPSSYFAGATNLVIAGSGDSGLTVASGTSSTARLLFADGTSGDDRYRGYIAYSHASNSMSFGTNAAEAMRIDTSGNVGIGQSAPYNNSKLDVVGSIISTSQTIGTYAANNAGFDYAAGTKIGRFFSTSSDATGGHMTFITGAGGGTERMRIDASGAVTVTANTTSDWALTVNNGTNSNAFGLYVNAPSTSGIPLRIDGGGSERMRIDSSGNVMVGTTTQYFARFSVQGETFQNAVTVRVGTNGYPAINFQNTSGAQQGYIVTNASSVQYISISDQRAKENIADADDAGSKIDSIQVRKFDWIADGSHQDYGMIAQELQAVAPEAVSGDADSENMMGVDYSKLVPMLVKEIQSLRTRVQTLENN